MAKIKLRNSTATYRYSNRKNDFCDLEELAGIYSNPGNVSERIGWVKAQEIALLARNFAILWRDEKRRRKSAEPSPDRADEPTGSGT